MTNMTNVSHLNVSKNYSQCVGDEIETDYSIGEKTIYSILCVLFCIIAFFGNLLVIVAITREPCLKRHKQNLYLLSLAVADALLACLVVPFSLTNQLTGNWPFGEVYCRVYLSLDIAFCTSSIWHIAMIGIDRYTSVRYPIFYRNYRSRKLILGVIVAVWIYSVIVSLLPNIFSTELIERSAGGCFINSSQWYILLSSSLSFFIPACIIVPVYTGVFIRGRKLTTTRKSSQGSEIRDHTSAVRNFHTEEKSRKISTISNTSCLDAQSIDDEKAKKKKGFFASLRCLIPSKFTNKKKNQRLSEELTIKNNNTDCPTPEKQRIFSEGSRFSFSVKSPNDKNEDGAKDFPGSHSSQTSLEPSPSIISTLSSPERKVHSGAPQQNNDESAPPVNSVSQHVDEKKLSITRDNGALLSPLTIKRPSVAVTKQAKTRMSHREKRFLFIILLVTGCIMFCWAPFFVTYSIFTLCKSCCINITLFNVFWWLGYLNSAANPIIYTTFNTDFRIAFKKILHLT